MIELVKNMQMCVTHSLRSQTQRTGPPRLTVTSALSGLIFLFSFCFAFLLLSTFGNTHRGAKPKCSSSFIQRASIIPTPIIGRLEVP